MVNPISNTQDTNHSQSAGDVGIVPLPQPISDSIQPRESSFLETFIEGIIAFFRRLCCFGNEENTVETSEYRNPLRGGHAGFPTRIEHIPQMDELLLRDLREGGDSHPGDTLAAFSMPFRELIENADPDIGTRIGYESNSITVGQYFFYITSNGEEYNFFDRLAAEQRVVIEQHWELSYERDESESINTHTFTARL